MSGDEDLHSYTPIHINVATNDTGNQLIAFREGFIFVQ